jgi:hypothetical protein
MLFIGCVAPNSVAPEAVVVKLGAIDVRMDELEKLMESKVDSTVFAERIGEVNLSTDQKLIDYDQKAQTIHNSGAGWVVISAALNVLIFLAVPVVLAIYFLRNSSKLRTLLGLVTTAVSESSSVVQSEVKAKIKSIVSDDSNGFSVLDQEELREFTIKNKTKV